MYDEALLLEPELRTEFIEKIGVREGEPVVQVADFRRHFGFGRECMTMPSEKLWKRYFSNL